MKKLLTYPCTEAWGTSVPPMPISVSYGQIMSTADRTLGVHSPRSWAEAAVFAPRQSETPNPAVLVFSILGMPACQSFSKIPRRVPPICQHLAARVPSVPFG